MSKERLEDIKNHRDDADRSNNEYEYEKINFYNLHVDWLIEQAERVQELDELVRAYQTELSIKDNANKRIKKKNKLYREALEFYANKKTYRYYKESYIDLLKDGGYIARKVLEGEE